MIKAVLLIFAVIFLVNIKNKPKSIEVLSPKASIKEPNKALKNGRLKVLPLIEEWIDQINASGARKRINYWEFKEGEIDVINFTFLFDSKLRTGRLYFKDDKNHPRVSKCIYEEDGKEKSIKGLILPEFSEGKIISSLTSEKADLRHISYINKVANKALKEGFAEFSIIDYQDIKPSDFEALYGKKEVKAFCKMLEKEDFEKAEPKEGPIITVLPKKLPNLD